MGALPATTDVVISGAGPVGLALALVDHRTSRVGPPLRASGEEYRRSVCDRV